MSDYQERYAFGIEVKTCERDKNSNCAEPADIDFVFDILVFKMYYVSERLDFKLISAQNQQLKDHCYK